MAELLTIAEAAAVVKRPVGTLRNWRYRGEGPPSFRLRSRIMYRLDELESWLREQEAVTGRGDSIAS